MIRRNFCRRLLLLVVVFSTARSIPTVGADVRRAFVEDAINARLILVPSGTFLMGSRFAQTVADEERKFFEDEAPPHQVRITKSFWVAESEVTAAQFRRFVNETSYSTDAESAATSLGEYAIASGTGGIQQGQWIAGKGLNWRNPGYMPEDSLPVTHVSWNDAKAFSRWLADKTGRPYRLLTEAEWEYAAGGPARTLYSWGNGQPVGKQGGNIADETFSRKFPEWKYPVLKTYNDYFAFLAPVCSYNANPFGLFDMTGNVWEWVEDLYSPTYYQSAPVDDPTGAVLENGAPPPEIKRVHRGGGFDWELPYLRVTKRRAAQPNTTSLNIGFRIALDDLPSAVLSK